MYRAVAELWNCWFGPEVENAGINELTDIGMKDERLAFGDECGGALADECGGWPLP